jgi:drug/metabolite transporter (DMT)-like permease
MKVQNVVQLVVLAALWGASFLFIRVGVTEFGVAPLMALRVGIGALCLLGVLFVRKPPREAWSVLRQRAGSLVILGVLNSGAPFCLFAFAELTLSAGVTSIINAATPLWSALIAFAWLKDRLNTPRVLGLAIGFAGVLTLVWDQIAAPSAGAATPMTSALAAAAALGATLCYGIAANYAKRHLSGVDALTLAAGSMSGSFIVLLPFALATWPHTPISPPAWGALFALGIACTAVAYFLFFHLLKVGGPSRATTVTFVIPIFGILWGALFLAERVSLAMLEGCAIVLVGTALATGFIKNMPWRRETRHLS